MRSVKLFILACVFLNASFLGAQTARFSGRVVDSSGGYMVGVDVKVFEKSSTELLREAKTNESGDFNLTLPSGEYRIEVTAPDFTPYSATIKVGSNTKPISIALKLANIRTEIDVADTNKEVSVSADPDSSLTAKTISGKEVEELPEDEDELAAYLQELAGVRGGSGNQGNFVIDGFANGRVPPRDQIQEIRINNSPYSAEFSGQGFGRIEIVTRAGTGNWQGGLNFNFRDAALNARNPFALTKPPYQVRNLNTQFSGPLIQNRLSLRFRAQNNETENSDSIVAVTPNGMVNMATVSPMTNRGFNAGGQWAITKNNSLNFSVNLNNNVRRNQGIGGFNLIERAFDSSSRNWEYQVRETAIIGTTLVHETRFEYSQNASSQTPRTSAIALNVLGSFSSGGAQNVSSSNNKGYEFGNLLTWSHGKMTLKTGFQGNYVDNHAVSKTNFLGTFTFSSLENYLAGKARTFTQTAGNPILELNQFEGASFIQTDWKPTSRFTLSTGLRYEAQSNLKDYNNFDPRMGFAYQIANNTVIRGGGGIFHQRLNINAVDQLMRLDGIHQQQIVIRDPSYPDPFLGGAVNPISIRVRAADLAAPYAINSSITVEQKLNSTTGMTVSFDTMRGVHMFRTRNLTAPLPGVAPDPTKGNVLQLESTGKSFSKNITVGFRENLPQLWNLTMFGNYTLGWNNNDTDGPFSLPSNNYDLASDWGQSPQDTRHRFQTGITLRMPHNINSMFFVQANSGRPFNITTGDDDNRDTEVNDRPLGVGRNSGDGPGSYNINMNFSKTFNLRRSDRSPRDAAGGGAGSSFAEPQRIEGGGFPGGRFPAGGQGPNGFPGGGPGPGSGGLQRIGGFGSSAGPRMTFNLSINNLLNNTQLRSYNGVLTSTFYGRATSAQNGRTMVLGLNFSF